MSKIIMFWEKIKIAFKKGQLSYLLRNSFRAHLSLRYVRRKEVRGLLAEDSAYNRLKRKYAYVLCDLKLPDEERRPSDKIWVCWLQGLENAPIISKTCIHRMQDFFGTDRVKIITADNYSDYVDIPDYIVDKWKAGLISHAHFSDILRVCLVAEGGGTWIDSTVFLMNGDVDKYFMNSPLFVFHNLRTRSVIRLSSWWISAYSHSPILEATKRLLFAYWKQESGIEHYFLFHLFFSMACEAFPWEWNQMPKHSNTVPHTLTAEIFTPYSSERYNQIANMCVVQKLSNKHALPDDLSGTFYDKLFLST